MEVNETSQEVESSTGSKMKKRKKRNEDTSRRIDATRLEKESF
jgi:hypothetical protein